MLECPEFRELMLFLGQDHINDDNIPHRNSLTRQILEEYKKEQIGIMDDLKVSVDTSIQ